MRSRLFGRVPELDRLSITYEASKKSFGRLAVIAPPKISVFTRFVIFPFKRVKCDDSSKLRSDASVSHAWYCSIIVIHVIVSCVLSSTRPSSSMSSPTPLVPQTKRCPRFHVAPYSSLCKKAGGRVYRWQHPHPP